jgi:hypothetical protein
LLPSGGSWWHSFYRVSNSDWRDVFTTADSIACGCLLALGCRRLTEHANYRRWIDSPAYLLIIPAVLPINALGRFAKLDRVFCSTA